MRRRVVHVNARVVGSTLERPTYTQYPKAAGAQRVFMPLSSTSSSLRSVPVPICVDFVVWDLYRSSSSLTLFTCGTQTPLHTYYSTDYASCQYIPPNIRVGTRSGLKNFFFDVFPCILGCAVSMRKCDGQGCGVDLSNILVTRTGAHKECGECERR